MAPAFLDPARDRRGRAAAHRNRAGHALPAGPAGHVRQHRGSLQVRLDRRRAQRGIPVVDVEGLAGRLRGQAPEERPRGLRGLRHGVRGRVRHGVRGRRPGPAQRAAGRRDEAPPPRHRSRVRQLRRLPRHHRARGGGQAAEALRRHGGGTLRSRAARKVPERHRRGRALHGGRPRPGHGGTVRRQTRCARPVSGLSGGRRPHARAAVDAARSLPPDGPRVVGAGTRGHVELGEVGTELQDQPAAGARAARRDRFPVDLEPAQAQASRRRPADGAALDRQQHRGQ